MSPERRATWRKNSRVKQAVEWLRNYRDPINGFGYNVAGVLDRSGAERITVWHYRYRGMDVEHKGDDQDLIDYCVDLGWKPPQD